MRWEVIKAEYVASAVKVSQFPIGDEPEVAFIGRSNVGKSTLINSLCRYNGLARTSGAPGKTRTVNFYRVTLKREDGLRRSLFLVDLPGYGYAKRSKSERQDLHDWTQHYFRESQRLRLVVQLLDIRRELQPLDIEVNEWIREEGLVVQPVATKMDKLSRGAAGSALRTLRVKLGLPPEAGMLGYSALTPSGRAELLERLVEALDFDATDAV
ncbi:MAG TPA: ribosome biogenesis GTP-binding protein YihA/YsxC [Negativicutes bacterium]|nr:ribosome biogenesis GTP-binding protein YihA/YsxC [Negativicutes bacterium]